MLYTHQKNIDTDMMTDKNDLSWKIYITLILA